MHVSHIKVFGLESRLSSSWEDLRVEAHSCLQVTSGPGDPMFSSNFFVYIYTRIHEYTHTQYV